MGGGAVYLLIFDNWDATVTQLRVDNHWGAALQAGAEYRLSPRLALYVDGKTAALKTRATAFLGAAPIEANIRLNSHGAERRALDPFLTAAGQSRAKTLRVACPSSGPSSSCCD